MNDADESTPKNLRSLFAPVGFTAILGWRYTART